MSGMDYILNKLDSLQAQVDALKDDRDSLRIRVKDLESFTGFDPHAAYWSDLAGHQVESMGRLRRLEDRAGLEDYADLPDEEKERLEGAA